MRIIREYVDLIDDELCSAKDYAERSLYFKSIGDVKFAKYFSDMASDELRHSGYLHDVAVTKIENLKKVYVAPDYMEEVWDKSHRDYVEKVSWIKQMAYLKN